MPPLRLLSAAEQVADYLRDELLRGTWSGELPGVNGLAELLRVNHKTVEAAVNQLEREGLLVSQGPRRRRRIELPADGMTTPSLRVGIMLSEPTDRHLDYIVEILHRLVQAGHAPFFPSRTLLDLGMDVKRVARFVQRLGRTGDNTPASAWIVTAGSRDVLEWFAEQPAPSFALFGRRHGLPMAGAGPDKVPCYIAVARHLIRNGHRRIVLLARPARRLPEPGESERALLGELAARGIQIGPYNLPDWEEGVDGFHRVLGSLFGSTPPTALIVDEASLFFATQQFLMSRGLRAPEDVSLVCTDGDLHFAWCRPSIAHIRWDSRPVVQRVMRWAAKVGRGRQDLRQTLTAAEFVEGGTIGPVRR